MQNKFTAVIVKNDDRYAGMVKELSGVHSQGKTIKEVRENLKEAVSLVVESNIKHFVGSATEYFEENIAVDI